MKKLTIAISLLFSTIAIAAINYHSLDEVHEVKFLLVTEKLNYDDAVARTPNGYHIPTRSELETLAKEFEMEYDSIKASPKYVWTLSRSDEGAWSIDMNSGKVSSHSRDTEFEVIYIGDL